MIFKYQNVVPIDGFEWREDLIKEKGQQGPGAAGTKPFLIPKGNQRRVTYPLEDTPTLFEDFAGLKGPVSELPKRVLKFANKYGSLGLGCMVYEPDKERTPILNGEGLNLWNQEIQDMAVAFLLWRLLNRHQLDLLRLYVHWHGETVWITWDPIRNFKVSENFDKTKPPGKVWGTHLQNSPVAISPGDFVGPARIFLQYIINKKLKNQVSPMAFMDREYNLYPYFFPSNLLGAMWFQFYQAVTGISNFVQCDICGGLIPITDKNRKSKTVHTRCAKNRSDHKRLGSQMFKNGSSMDEIVERTGEDQKTVEGWFTGWAKGGQW